MTKPTGDDIENLAEFVRHVRDLGRLRFAKAVLAQPSITLRMSAKLPAGEFLNFDEEDCRSFLLGCRLLMQDNDRVSVGRIWKTFANRTNDDAWFARINPPRWMLNEYLDRDADFAAPGGRSVTNRVILNTFLHGSYAHLNPDHRKRFLRWEAHPQFHYMKLLFLMAVKVLYQCSSETAAIVSDWLDTAHPQVKAMAS